MAPSVTLMANWALRNSKVPGLVSAMEAVAAEYADANGRIDMGLSASP